MAKANYTYEQLLAIQTRDCDLLVSAAAGSGKTAVLVERIIRIALDPKNPVDLDKLLVVTFTEAAACEMKNRLEKALTEEIRANPKNKYLQKQLLLIGKAQITTIHSFCLRVVRQFFNQAGVDPGFRVADITEIALLLNETAQSLFMDLYNPANIKLFQQLFNSETNSDFLALVEAYGDKVRDDALQKLVIRMHHFSQSRPFPERWLLEQADLHKYSSFYDMEKTDWYAAFLDDCKEVLEGALENIENVINISVECEYLPAQNIAVFNAEKKYIQNALGLMTENSTFSAIHAAMKFPFARLTSAKSKKSDGGRYTDDDIATLRQTVKEIREEFVKNPIQQLQKSIFNISIDSILPDANEAGKMIRSLCMVTYAFSARFAKEKRAKNIADFSDFEHLCLKVLLHPDSTEESLILTNAAMELSARFNEVMVDEYQDSNMVQEMILQSVSGASRGKRNMFMVGDMKQSIYKFRLADPSIFLSKYNSYNGTHDDQKLITLSKNFRSRNVVIDSINLIFSRLMSTKFGDISYDAQAMLYCGADYPEINNVSGTETEILLIDTYGEDNDISIAENPEESDETGKLLLDLSKTELEAKYTAERIRTLLDEPFLVTGKDGIPRPVEQKDIAILLRSPKSTAEIYINELKNQNIQGFSDVTGGYFEAIEVLIVLALLRIVDNPLQDIPLISVLHSPIYAFTGDELIEIRLCGHSKENYYHCVERYAQTGESQPLRDKITDFLQILEFWREQASYLPVNELIWVIYNDTGYFNYAGAMEGGLIRQANLIALFERAVEYEKTSYKGLFHFIRYIERLQASDTELGTAKTLNSGADVVRIMSIHKSKGLEFPVVLVCGLSKKFNLQDLNATVNVHQKLGIASYCTDLERRTRINTLPRYAVTRRMLRENLSEELRVLYVALTRAREKIILIGTVEKADEKLAALSKIITPSKPVSPSYLLEQNNYLSWILAATYSGKIEKGFSLLIVGKSCAVEQAEEDMERRKKFASVLQEIDPKIDYSGKKDEIVDRLTYQYPNWQLASIPAKMSVSEIKRRFDAMWQTESATIDLPEIYKKPDFREPDFITMKKNELNEIDPARRGTIMHIVMERIPFDIKPEKQALSEYLFYLTDKEILSEDELEFVSEKAILDFISSDLWHKICDSPYVKREARFVVGISPCQLPEYANIGSDIKDEILIHGIIDCMFEENGELIILDYKTDRLRDISAEEAAKRYVTQLSFYKLAIEKTTKKKVKKCLLYFFDKGEIVELTPE